MSSNVTVKLDVRRLTQKILDNARRAKFWLKNEVSKDCFRFVPFRGPGIGGGLRQSVEPSVDADDDQLVYDVIYAKKQYYGDSYRHTTAGTTSRWFEKAKAIHKDKWIRGVAKIGGYRT